MVYKLKGLLLGSLLLVAVGGLCLSGCQNDASGGGTVASNSSSNASGSSTLGDNTNASTDSTAGDSQTSGNLVLVSLDVPNMT